MLGSLFAGDAQQMSLHLLQLSKAEDGWDLQVLDEAGAELDKEASLLVLSALREHLS